MWWYHLLVRRVDLLGERVETMERVVRSVGPFAYAERCKLLLMRRTKYRRGGGWVDYFVMKFLAPPINPFLCISHSGDMFAAMGAEDRVQTVLTNVGFTPTLLDFLYHEADKILYLT
jgi:hypothetical protein